MKVFTPTRNDLVENCERCFKHIPRHLLQWHERQLHVDDSTVKTCQGCGAGFSTATLLQTHLESNAECLSVHVTGRKRPGTYSCERCGLRLSGQQKVLSHLRQMHPEEMSLEILCRSCHKRFFHPILFKAHVKKMHPDQSLDSLSVEKCCCPRHCKNNKESCNKNCKLDLYGSKQLSKCKFCECAFYHQSNASFAHLTSQHADALLKCSFCHKLFFSAEEDLHKINCPFNMKKIRALYEIGQKPQLPIKISTPTIVEVVSQKNIKLGKKPFDQGVKRLLESEDAAIPPKKPLVAELIKLLPAPQLTKTVQTQSWLNLYEIKQSCEVCKENFANGSLETIEDHLVACIQSKAAKNRLFQRAMLGNFGRMYYKHLNSCPGPSSLNLVGEPKRKMTYTCTFCQDQFAEIPEVHKHVEGVHQVPIFSFAFLQILKTKAILERVQIKCPHCSHRDKVPAMRLHLVAKPFADGENNLQCRHLKKLYAGCEAPRPRLPWPCDFCGLKFKTSADLEEHVRERHPVKCDYCELRLREKVDVVKHVLAAHPDRLDRCQLLDFGLQPE